MALNLKNFYPGKTTIDASNPNGTFKNRTSDTLKDGTPYEKSWASDVWGFLAHILKLAGITPNNSEENETNSQYYAGLESLVGRREVLQESKELVIELLGVITVKVDAVRLSLLDSSFIPKYLDDLDITFTMPTDLMAGTSEKSSHQYQMWIDSDLNKRLVPDLIGTTDGTTAGFLVDSTNTFFNDLVTVGDTVRNRTNKTETTVSVTPIIDGADLNVTDSIFASGEDYEIRILSPEGLVSNKALIGQVFNDGSNNFTEVEKYGAARLTKTLWHTVNAHGSSSNKIQKFTTEVDKSNDIVVTIVNSATLGFTITANMDCEIDISFVTNLLSANNWSGISKNSSQLTIAFETINAEDRMVIEFGAANNTVSTSVNTILKKGDVLRPHTTGGANGGFPETGLISVKAREII